MQMKRSVVGPSASTKYAVPISMRCASPVSSMMPRGNTKINVCLVVTWGIWSPLSPVVNSIVSVMCGAAKYDRSDDESADAAHLSENHVSRGERNTQYVSVAPLLRQCKCNGIEEVQPMDITGGLVVLEDCMRQ